MKKNEGLNYITIEGKEVINLLPDNEERQAALVDLSALQRVISNLDTVDLFTVKARFSDRIMRANTLKEYLGMIAEEVSFHHTVNIIRTIEVKKFEEELA